MSKLSEIEPTTSQRLIDLVEAAGVNVGEWGNFKGGKEYAARNPKFCYEWAFVDPKKVVVLNLWHNLMEDNGGGTIMMNTNMREFAARRSGPEKRRALDMDQAIQTAIKNKLPVRVVVLGGRRRNISNPEEKASQVSKRLLDPGHWTVTAYNWETGETVLTRGVHRFVDQFSAQEEPGQKPERRDVSGEAFVRSPVVRNNVLLRANGKCEWCGQSGFLMLDGSIYLETHHVIPLCEGGPDIENNVTGLCPNHHREAHFGKLRTEMRNRLLERLGTGRRSSRPRYDNERC